jgi:glutamate-5-semialdehyde dehydrogenase
MTADGLERPLPEASVADVMRAIGLAAKSAAERLALAPSALKNRALLAAAAALRANRHRVLAANERDLRDATSAGVTPAMLDRLRLD